jgi:hypothetical protein
MTILETAIKAQESLVQLRSLEVTEALNAKRYANKYNSVFLTQLRQNLQDAEVRYSLACSDLIKLYTFANSQKVDA